VILNTISPKVHGYLDYGMAANLIAGPFIYGFNKKDRLATTISMSAGFAALGLSLLTKYPLGALRVIPFKTHGAIETAAASFLAVAPLLFNFKKTSTTNFLAITGLAYLGVIAMTNYSGTVKTKKVDITNSEQVAA
jgi:hypothetical protein